MSLTTRAVRGAFWMLIDTSGGQILSFFSFMILARLLSPEDYGIVTLAGAIVAVPSILLNEGLCKSLIQRDTVTDGHLNAAFWTNLILSFFFVALLQSAASWAAELTQTPQLEPVLRLISLTLIGNALNAVAAAVFIRDLRYSQFALRTLITRSIGAIVAVTMALSACGIWSLVAMQMCTLIGIAVLWKDVEWRPTLSLDIKALGEIWYFASRLMVGNALLFAAEKADALIIGIFLDARSLGLYYMMTRSLATINMATISPIDQVMLPVLSRMKDDRRRRIETYSTLVGAVSVLSIPTAAGLGMTSPVFLPLLFGDQWKSAVPLMMIGSLIALSGPLTRPTMPLLLSVGRPDVYARLTMIQLLLMIVLFTAGVQFGIIGAAWAYAGMSLAMTPLNLYWARRVAEISVKRVLARYMPAVGASAIMVAVLFAIQTTSRGIGVLATEIIVGALVYVTALYAMAPTQVLQFLGFAYAALPSRFRFSGADRE
jgi:O-antigen/teichoic acid export membrane protein